MNTKLEIVIKTILIWYAAKSKSNFFIVQLFVRKDGPVEFYHSVNPTTLDQANI